MHLKGRKIILKNLSTFKGADQERDRWALYVTYYCLTRKFEISTKDLLII